MDETEKSRLKQDLIFIYDRYILDMFDKEIKSRAQKLFFDNLYNNEFFEKEINDAIFGLEHIGWDFPRGLQSFSQWKLNKEQAQEILLRLNGVKREENYI